jgi:menaquinone-dependent protoporphyrinogen oxidase
MRALVTYGSKMGGTAGLAPDAPGLVARAMARSLAGDWRDPDQVARWADEIVAALVPGSVGR